MEPNYDFENTFRILKSQCSCNISNVIISYLPYQFVVLSREIRTSTSDIDYVTKGVFFHRLSEIDDFIDKIIRIDVSHDDNSKRKRTYINNASSVARIQVLFMNERALSGSIFILYRIDDS